MRGKVQKKNFLPEIVRKIFRSLGLGGLARHGKRLWPA
jgi:hypothetical protein